MARSRKSRLFFGLAGAAALPALVACNAILGLGDFEKGLCAGGEPCADVFVPDVLVTEGGEGGADVQIDVRGADPVSWAKWKMPNYDAGPDSGLPNGPTYSVSVADDVVLDNITQLPWKATPVASKSLSEAKAVCAALPGGPWRIPKRIELVTLLDYSRATASVFIDTKAFPGVKNVKVWSSSEVRPLAPLDKAQSYWIVDFANGAVVGQDENLRADVLCVRAK